MYKSEKRRCSGFEQELDQLKYTHAMLTDSSGDEVKNLREQTAMMKSENRQMQEKLERQFKEMQGTFEEERKLRMRVQQR
jgi:hypothetical protein